MKYIRTKDGHIFEIVDYEQLDSKTKGCVKQRGIEMIVKMKSYYLKKDANPTELIKYGFIQFGNNYSKDLICSTCDIRYYDNTRRIVFVDYPWKDARGRKVKDYINDLIKDGLVELKTNYEWLAIIGSWHNYSQKKKDRIQAKLDKLNKGN